MMMRAALVFALLLVSPALAQDMIVGGIPFQGNADLTPAERQAVNAATRRAENEAEHLDVYAAGASRRVDVAVARSFHEIEDVLKRASAEGRVKPDLMMAMARARADADAKLK